MFTGIIEGLGDIAQVQASGNERRFQIQPLFSMTGITDGESIAVNGVCLSVETHREGMFTAYASAETLKASTLGSLAKGAKVNLERALKVGDRLGGHIMSGHVDCVATVARIARAGQSLGIMVKFPERFGAEVIRKGSVALDGISLTINDCGRDFLEVNIIPDSQKRTNICQWRKGSRINMETDVIGKYVQRMLDPWRKADHNFLAENGFI